MTGFWILLGDWGYALAAALFTALAIVASRRPVDAPARSTLVIALTLTALWALCTVAARAVGGAPGFSAGVAETARNAAWLALCWQLLRGEGAATLPAGARHLFVALLVALACQLCLDLFLSEWEPPARSVLSLFHAAWVLRAVTALGAIFLLQGLHARIGHGRDGATGWLSCALVIMWAYEFNHYLLALLSDGRVIAIGQLRGLVMAFVAPLIMLGTGRRERRRIGLSRPMAYHTATLVIGIAYAFALFAMVMLIRVLDDPAAQMVQLGVVFALSVIALILLPSAPFRAWLRVEIAKHLFTYRYDYRREWMRFAEALGGEEDLPPRRAAKAVAHVVNAPAALLMLRDEEGLLVPEADWNWPEMADPAHSIDPAVTQDWAATGWIGDLLGSGDPVAPGLPDWIRGERRCWALVPLVHGADLLGAVLLARPPGRGRLDWEDLDMLRVVAQQLALTLSEQRHQRALAEAQRFDEFNRRFAFILHDIKNMVSQMRLLAANAERHAENPDFRADMVLTLKDTSERMTDLIARLGRPEQPRGSGHAVCDLAAIARDVARRGQARERTLVTGAASLPVRGDIAGLEQAIGHLLQNAMEATSADGPPVHLTLSREGDMARLDIVDRGAGMSAAFLRDGLFRPFASTKATGFGLGAHEARSIVDAMGGRLTVASREGEGSCFTLSLPLVADEDVMMPAPRKAG